MGENYHGGGVCLWLYLALFTSPPDYQQGESVRIMYVHVPAAWMSMFTYMVVAAASFTALVWRHPVALLAGKAAAPIGATFTALALITGMLWGKPMWGTYWVWDGRLTSVLVLFFLYLGYMALWRGLDEEDKAGRAASILALVGVVNIPIIKFSVDWWNTLHQPSSVMRMDGPTMPAEMLWPLLTVALAFKAYFIVVFLYRMKLEINLRKLTVLSSIEARG
ncbi:heme ABC transporter permease [Kordiimonas gwangyangensis]|uniref:heme ABC transporter permease n=1 Tax=Kordiimonas gwangyangensis TaxID=288022 RepID=UPI000A677847|nr:heme ABC transporter permease [Kordiimonas gwangyangensis]